MKLISESETARLYGDENGIGIERTGAGMVEVYDQHRREFAWRVEYFREALKTLEDDDLYDLHTDYFTSFKTISRTDRTILIEWAGSRSRLKLSEFQDGRYYRYPHNYEWGWKVRPKLVEAIEELEQSLAKLNERIAYWQAQPQDEWFEER